MLRLENEKTVASLASLPMVPLASLMAMPIFAVEKLIL